MNLNWFITILGSIIIFKKIISFKIKLLAVVRSNVYKYKTFNPGIIINLFIRDFCSGFLIGVIKLRVMEIKKYILVLNLI
jgi:hypothetical protein